MASTSTLAYVRSVDGSSGSTLKASSRSCSSLSSNSLRCVASPHVRNDPPAEQRQQTYLNALAAHSRVLDIRQGRFQQKSKTCHRSRLSWFEYEEKEMAVTDSVLFCAASLRPPRSASRVG